jgi:hypothetical protein
MLLIQSGVLWFLYLLILADHIVQEHGHPSEWYTDNKHIRDEVTCEE